MNWKTVTTVSALLTLSAPAFARSPIEGYFTDPRVPTEVQAAHDAFLRGDFAQLGVNIKKAIMAYPTDPGVREDMLELYDKAYELKGYPGIPADWSAPQGVTFLSVGVKKRYDPVKGTVRYRMDVYADMSKGQEVQQVQLIRFPGEVISDNSGNLGYFEASEQDGVPNFWLGGDYHSSPNVEGMYLLNIQIKGQEMVHGWFLVSKMNASESPVINVPTVDQTFNTTTPSFYWNDFVSPEYRSFERRRIYLSVVERKNDAKDNTWALGIRPPASSATIGAGLEGEEGAKQLKSGDYVFQVSYRERIKFGDLVIGRESSSVVPFSVK